MGLMISNPSNRTSLINKQESSDFTYIDTEASLKKKQFGPACNCNIIEFYNSVKKNLNNSYLRFKLQWLMC